MTGGWGMGQAAVVHWCHTARLKEMRMGVEGRSGDFVLSSLDLFSA